MEPEIFIFLILKEFCGNIFLSIHYPIEIIHLILLKYCKKIKINCGYCYTTIIKDKIYVLGPVDTWYLDYLDSNFYQKLSNVKSIKCGVFHALGLKTNGDVYTWGKIINVEHKSPHKLLSNVKKISCGFYHSAAITKSEIFTWGENKFGQLGLGDNLDYREPQKLKLELESCSNITCGCNYVMTWTSSDIHVWGQNSFGQLGLGDTQDHNKPEKLFLLYILKISCGASHSMALSKYGELFVWGYNFTGQLGLGDTRDRINPVKHSLENVISISCGGLHTLFLTKNGNIWSCGSNLFGQIGVRTSSNYYHTPCKIDLSNIKSVKCGHDYSMVITIYDEIFVWGNNYKGQLGLGDSIQRNIPHKLRI